MATAPAGSLAVGFAALSLLICGLAGYAWHETSAQLAAVTAERVRLRHELDATKSARTREKSLMRSKLVSAVSQLKVRIPLCDEVAFATDPLNRTTQWKTVDGGQKIPATACARYGDQRVIRNNICSVRVYPPYIPPSLISKNASLDGPARHAAISAHVKPGGKYVEVGTMKGETATFLWRTLKPSQLLIMDIGKDEIDHCKAKRAHGIAAGRVQCLLGDSREMLSRLPDSTYDMIYVDADHDYKGVCADLEAARTKVKPGGLMVLNDYYWFETQFMWRSKAGRPVRACFGLCFSIGTCTDGTPTS